MRWWRTAGLASVLAVACGSSRGGEPEAGAGEGGEGGSGPGTGGTSSGRGGQAGKGSGGDAATGGEDTDPSGAGQSGSSGSGEGGAGSPQKPLPGSALFTDDRVLEVRLTLAESDWQELEEHGDREEFVPAAATLSGNDFAAVSFDEIGVRHKGSYSLHHCWDEFDGVRSHADECEKLSLKLKFDEYDADGRLDGLKRLNLHAASGDETKLRDLLSYDLFRDFGIAAPRVAPARVYVNGELLGLFIAVEEVDGRFTKAHFPNGPDGNLYKEIWPRTEVSDEDFAAALETNEEAADVTDMRDFAAAIAGSNADDFVERMAPWVDLDQVLRYVVVDRATKNWDGITAFYTPYSSHNFFWYHDDSSRDRFHLIPWDLDNTLWEFDPYMHPEQWATAPPVPDWNSKPLDCTPRSVWEVGGSTNVTPPRCDPFLDLLARTSWPRFVALGNELLEGPFTLSRLNAKVSARSAQLASLVAEDPTLDVEAWQSAVSDLSTILAQNIEDFRDFLAEGLIEEQPPPPPELTPDELNVPTADTGLHIDGMTNFEFAAPTSGFPLGVSVVSDGTSTVQASWNDASAISGNADLLFNFTFARGPEPYDEWVNLDLRSAVTNIDALTRIMVTLRTDVPRTVRIRLRSSVYDTEYAGVWSEFGQDFGASAVPRTVELTLHDLVYPSWARDAWTDGQGWTTSDEAALANVLQNFGGLIFVPGATLDPSGELKSAEETGFVAIDNIYFR